MTYNIRNIDIPIPYELTPNYTRTPQITARVQYEWVGVGLGRILKTEFQEIDFMYLATPHEVATYILEAVKANSFNLPENKLVDRKETNSY